MRKSFVGCVVRCLSTNPKYFCTEYKYLAETYVFLTKVSTVLTIAKDKLSFLHLCIKQLSINLTLFWLNSPLFHTNRLQNMYWISSVSLWLNPFSSLSSINTNNFSTYYSFTSTFSFCKSINILYIGIRACYDCFRGDV